MYNAKRNEIFIANIKKSEKEMFANKIREKGTIGNFWKNNI